MSIDDDGRQFIDGLPVYLYRLESDQPFGIGADDLTIDISDEKGHLMVMSIKMGDEDLDRLASTIAYHSDPYWSEREVEHGVEDGAVWEEFLALWKASKVERQSLIRPRP